MPTNLLLVEEEGVVVAVVVVVGGGGRAKPGIGASLCWSCHSPFLRRFLVE